MERGAWVMIIAILVGAALFAPPVLMWAASIDTTPMIVQDCDLVWSDGVGTWDCK